MRVSWFLVAALLVVAVAQVFAVPLDNNNNPEETYTGSKTINALKNLFRPMTDYFVKKFPTKTPTEVATDVKKTVAVANKWAKENVMIQALVSSLNPVRSWIKEKADVMKNKTFQEMYNDVKTKVGNIDNKISTWINERNSQ
ncbi:uncharacterized protein LOC121853172 [Homarus americanus]|uniref:Uncharacterized protein n=1 Tax=Homarus americanus TaxID=6706 RepID=A0A8J5JJS7_HOMAM|nr:uncharacterized protein LOC121853172 [Homarus americanus]KAG7156925.1 hypothetical protein Hamer_G015853 [Homarus americanus]